jgi:hypothetical protein
MTTISTQPRQISLSETIADLIVGGSLCAATGALATYLVTSIQPMGGALFGLVNGISSSIIANLLDKLFGNSSSEKVLKYALGFFIPIALSVGAASLAGYTITIGTGIWLMIAMIPSAIITGLGFNCLKSAAKA